MKLDEFLAHRTFSKYTKEVAEFRDEFINEGCEMFLWPSFSAECRAINNASKASRAHPIKTTHPHITKLINHLSAIDEHYITFIYPEDYSPKFLMAQEVAKMQQKHMCLTIFLLRMIQRIGLQYLIPRKLRALV